ncbi:MAG: hypothetical protein EOP11_08040 [Proteobacteria bacterium]|nr:MAG: hypothetical protein EOP11_08040 [Pseudomonadota bacterium]
MKWPLKALLILGLAGLIALLYVALRARPVDPAAALPAPSASPPPVKVVPPAPVPAPAAKPVDPKLQGEVEAFRAGTPVVRVQRFYGAESARVGAIDNDPGLTQRRLEAMAAELTAAEIEWLKNAALDRKRGGDGRFFAAFLLALAPGQVSAGALRGIALDPVPNLKNQGLVELERQVRAQATEGLGHQRGNVSAQDALLDVVQYQKDEFVRDRAHRALHEWRTGKTVEAQDEEALRKVREKGE